MEDQPKSLIPQIGGTAIAFVVAIIVVFVVSSIVAFLMSMFQYYIGNMREEAALFIGNVAGGVVSVYAARSACDATIKHYSARAIFVLISIVAIALAGFLLSKGLEQNTVFRMAFLVPAIITSYVVFWKEDF